MIGSWGERSSLSGGGWNQLLHGLDKCGEPQWRWRKRQWEWEGKNRSWSKWDDPLYGMDPNPKARPPWTSGCLSGMGCTTSDQSRTYFLGRWQLDFKEFKEVMMGGRSSCGVTERDFNLKLMKKHITSIAYATNHSHPSLLHLKPALKFTQKTQKWMHRSHSHMNLIVYLVGNTFLFGHQNSWWEK